MYEGQGFQEGMDVQVHRKVEATGIDHGPWNWDVMCITTIISLFF